MFLCAACWPVARNVGIFTRRTSKGIVRTGNDTCAELAVPFGPPMFWMFGTRTSKLDFATIWDPPASTHSPASFLGAVRTVCGLARPARRYRCVCVCLSEGSTTSVSQGQFRTNKLRRAFTFLLEVEGSLFRLIEGQLLKSAFLRPPDGERPCLQMNLAGKPGLVWLLRTCWH